MDMVPDRSAGAGLVPAPAQPYFTTRTAPRAALVVSAA